MTWVTLGPANTIELIEEIKPNAINKPMIFAPTLPKQADSPCAGQ